jgi:hypothetical protein
MPNGMGRSFDEDMLKSPLTVGRPGREPGPEVHNNPVAMPDDPMKYIPGNSRKAGRKSGL